ncbi:unnamed protein product [Larinioides sclopetarius]|uniref:Uncharacterized protein n=1 Tax=Larinioides sclopetarius TaxID=280406 RepID=A0AAV2BBN5_9ARAC
MICLVLWLLDSVTLLQRKKCFHQAYHLASFVVSSEKKNLG